MSKSTRPGLNGKPDKPYADFPLFPHATRRWAKKIRGKLHYFGPWDDPDAALQKYLDQRDDLHAGRTPRVQGEGLTVRDLVNRFLTAKRYLLDTREITPRTFADYYATCERLVGAFGRTRLVDDLAADDFERLRADLAARWGPVALGNEIQRVRVVFKYADDAGLIDRPIRYGPGFKRPSKKTLRLARAAKGPRLFEAGQLRALLAEAGLQLKAMFLLGVNCGLGNTDCAGLCLRHLDLDGGWLNYPRPKTGIGRRCPLWLETVAALRAVLARRPEPKDPAHADLVFLTKYRTPWVKAAEKKRPDGTVKALFDDALAKEAAKLLKGLGLWREGLGFYTLRHVFETVGGGARDQVAVDHIMGHADASMAGAYREEVPDDRLRCVTDHVHAWLFPPAKKARRRAAAEKKTSAEPGLR
jgi:integrase